MSKVKRLASVSYQLAVQGKLCEAVVKINSNEVGWGPRLVSLTASKPRTILQSMCVEVDQARALAEALTAVLDAYDEDHGPEGDED